MKDTDVFREIVNETCDLLRRTARGKRRTVSLSPEVAKQLDRLQVAMDRRREAEATQPVAAPRRAKDAGTSSILDTLREEVVACTRCPLHESRTQTVFGTGNPHAELVFVGEAPGHDEDVQGKPFVGRAGQLLTDIIEKGMKLTRDDVYICNVLKCRPPANRDPLPSEVEMCEPYLIRQLEIIKPKVICALGKWAAQTLLKTDVPIGKLRGVWHFYHGIPLRATYHPAYLLRNPADKRKTWDDVQEVMKVLSGEVVPKPGQ